MNADQIIVYSKYLKISYIWIDKNVTLSKRKGKHNIVNVII